MRIHIRQATFAPIATAPAVPPLMALFADLSMISLKESCFSPDDDVLVVDEDIFSKIRLSSMFQMRVWWDVSARTVPEGVRMALLGKATLLERKRGKTKTSARKRHSSSFWLGVTHDFSRPRGRDRESSWTVRWWRTKRDSACRSQWWTIYLHVRVAMLVSLD